MREQDLRRVVDEIADLEDALEEMTKITAELRKEAARLGRQVDAYANRLHRTQSRKGRRR